MAEKKGAEPKGVVEVMYVDVCIYTYRTIHKKDLSIKVSTGTFTLY